MAKLKKLKRTGQTAEQVFRRLIEAILAGEFASGSAVRESRLARDWKVGRTPLREAMRRAAESGFIVLRHNRAPLIRPLSAQDVRDLYALREVLELHALQLAFPRLTDDALKTVRTLAEQAKPGKARDWSRRCLELDLALHGLWRQHCGNPWLTADLVRHYHFLRFFQGWIGRNPQSLAQAYDEHLAILDALERRDQSEAVSRLRQHIQASARMVEEALPEKAPAGG